jgi:hypothetical protein
MNDSEQWTGRHVEESGKQVISRPLPLGCWGKPRTPAIIAGLTSNNLSRVQHTQPRRTRVQITSVAGVPTLVQPVPFDTRTDRHGVEALLPVDNTDFGIEHRTTCSDKQLIFPRCYAFMDPPPPRLLLLPPHTFWKQGTLPRQQTIGTVSTLGHPLTHHNIFIHLHQHNYLFCFIGPVTQLHVSTAKLSSSGH